MEAAMAGARRRRAVVAVAAMVVMVAAAGEGPRCAELGFDRDSVQCAVCPRLEAALGKVSGAGEVARQCRACCSEEERFDSAQLVLDMRYLARLPALKEFVTHKAAKYPQLEVKEKFEQRPQLVLHGAASGKEKRIPVHAWEAQHLEDFVREKLVISAE